MPKITMSGELQCGDIPEPFDGKRAILIRLVSRFLVCLIEAKEFSELQSRRHGASPCVSLASRAKQAFANPNMCCAKADGTLIVAAHSHTQASQAIAFRHLV